MKTASRILGTAFFIEGFEVQDAPIYGAERRGAPVFAYVRAGRKPINERGAISNPALVVVADDTLIPVPAAGVIRGVTEDTVLLINSDEEPETWRDRLKLTGPVVTMPGLKAGETRDVRFTGAVSAAAAAAVTGVISKESLRSAIREEIGPLGEVAVDENLKMATKTFLLTAGKGVSLKEGSSISAAAYRRPEWIDLAFEAATLSAPSIHSAATSERMKTGLWRTVRPVVDYDRCNRCWWLCSTFCPDGAISVNKEGFPEIDYEHCKGCMICMAQCPPHAISAEAERGTKEGKDEA